MINKVEICGVNTARLPTLTREEKDKLFVKIKAGDIVNLDKEINVEADKASEKSIFEFYKQLVQIRKEHNAVRHGLYENQTDGRVGCYIYKMTDQDTNKAIVVVCNFENENVISLDVEGKCILSNRKT